jgi:hypothetical protein
MRRPKARSAPLVGKAPLGSLPAEGGQSAASTQHEYRVGDIVFWATPTVAGEYLVIGYLKDEPDVLVFDNEGEVPAKDCQPTDMRNPQRGREYRQKYLRKYPGRLVGNP